MSHAVLQQTTRALQLLLHDAVGDATFSTPDQSVRLGPLDLPSGGTEAPVSLFLFHIEPNRPMRNEPRVVDGGELRRALAVDARFVISVNRIGAAGGTEDLSRMGRILEKLEANPTLGPPLVPDQSIRLTPEPYPMEELSRVWGLYGATPYRTSVVYLASPIFVDADVPVLAERVTGRRFDAGQSAEPPDFGRIEA